MSQAVSQQILPGLDVQLKPAPMGKRILAYILDNAIISIVMYLGIFVFLIPTGIISMAALEQNGELADGPIIVILIVYVLTMVLSTHLYNVIQEHKKSTTFGKKVFGLSVVSLDGRRLSLGQILTRKLFVILIAP